MSRGWSFQMSSQMSKKMCFLMLGFLFACGEVEKSSEGTEIGDCNNGADDDGDGAFDCDDDGCSGSPLCSEDTGGEPSGEPGSEPSGEPGSEPSGEPGSEPSGEPGSEPSGEPGSEPSGEPGSEPSGEPSSEPGSSNNGGNNDGGSAFTDDDGDGLSENDGDCDDTDPTIYAGAIDFLEDGIDQSCDGIDGTDGDGDGYASELTGGDDCDDLDENSNPAAIDIAGD
ncbi:MAG: hypothetical protein CMK59_08700, partial [Proteobacteria bacterium]|nr:hypothetical protein [Pseudomonadota bacterium]